MASTNFDPSQVAAIIKLGGKSYMFPVASFVYPVFYNLDMFKAAGITNPPTNRTEFLRTLKTDQALEEPVRLGVAARPAEPNGVQNDVMSWVWASGKSMLKDGQPTLPIPL